MTSRKFKHWAYLNKEGMELFGKVFKNRQVPVISMIPKTGPLGIHENIEEYFKVQWDELKDDQRDEILNILSKKFGVTKKQVKDQIAESGLPLRSSLTNGSGTNHPGFFT